MFKHSAWIWAQLYDPSTQITFIQRQVFLISEIHVPVRHYHVSSNHSCVNEILKALSMSLNHWWSLWFVNNCHSFQKKSYQEIKLKNHICSRNQWIECKQVTYLFKLYLVILGGICCLNIKTMDGMLHLLNDWRLHIYIWSSYKLKFKNTKIFELVTFLPEKVVCWKINCSFEKRFFSEKTNKLKSS